MNRREFLATIATVPIAPTSLPQTVPTSQSALVEKLPVLDAITDAIIYAHVSECANWSEDFAKAFFTESPMMYRLRNQK